MSKSEHELSITRFIDAPPETVYRVYTERTEEWWAPRPWKSRVIARELSAGGPGTIGGASGRRRR